jgi:hypothetical protein
MGPMCCISAVKGAVQSKRHLRIKIKKQERETLLLGKVVSTQIPRVKVHNSNHLKVPTKKMMMMKMNIVVNTTQSAPQTHHSTSSVANVSLSLNSQ